MEVGSIKTSRRSLLLGSSMVLLSVATPLGLSRAAAQDVTIQTRVKVLHAATNTGEVEVHFNGAQDLEEFGYGDQSDFIDIDPGAVRVTITADRIGFNYAIFDAQYPVAAGNDYLLVITDALILTGRFDNSSSAFEGSRVQFMHGSVDTPAVTVTVSGGALALATDLGYSQTSDTVAVPAGSYDVEVTLADTGEVLLTQSGVTIDENQAYVWVLMGDPTDSDFPLTITALQDDLVESAGSATPVS